MVASWQCPARSRQGEGESTVGWGQCGSEIGRERRSADGRGLVASERKREGRDARALGPWPGWLGRVISSATGEEKGAEGIGLRLLQLRWAGPELREVSEFLLLLFFIFYFIF